MLRGLLHAAGAESQEEATPEQKADAAKWEAEIAKRRYAVIVDEAHSSQTGETARELKAILGAAASAENGEEEPDWEDRLNQVMQSRGRQPNLSFFAFTATPKGKTLELFGRTGRAGCPRRSIFTPCGRPSRKAFILDVVKNYTTYATYYRLVKAIEDDPNLPKKKAARALAKFMSLHPHNIEQKTEVMVEHFPAEGAEPSRRTSQGNGRHLVAPPRGALHAGVRALYRGEQIHRHPPAGRLQRHGQRPGHRPRIHRAGDEHGLREREADQREATAGALRVAGLPGIARGEQIPDRLRPAAALRHVCGQAARWRAGGADLVAVEPEDSRQGKPVRPRFRQRGRGHLPRLQALLRRDELAGGFRPAAVGEAETRTGRRAGLFLERGRGVRPRLLQARGPAKRAGPRAGCSFTFSRRWIASRRWRTSRNAASSARS